MGLFSKAVDSFFSSKKKAELKVQKEQEIKDFWIKNGVRFEKCLGDFFEFLNDYPKDRIEVEDMAPYIDKQREIVNWMGELQTSIGTYGLKNIEVELNGYTKFFEKYNMITVYLNVKKNLCDIQLKSLFIKNKWDELKKKVKEFDGNGFDEFEDEGQKLLLYEMENMMNHKKQIDLIKDFESTFPSTIEEGKRIIVERLGKEGRSITGTEDDTTEIIKEYQEKKKKADPNWEPKTYKL